MNSGEKPTLDLDRIKQLSSEYPKQEKVKRGNFLGRIVSKVSKKIPWLTKWFESKKPEKSTTKKLEVSIIRDTSSENVVDEKLVKITNEIKETEKTYKKSVDNAIETLENLKRGYKPDSAEYKNLIAYIEVLSTISESSEGFIKSIKKASRGEKLNEILDFYTSETFDEYVESTIAYAYLYQETKDVSDWISRELLVKENKRLTTKKSTGLSALMITPVQRMTRHQLFVQEIIKRVGFEDKKSWQKALEQVKRANEKMNEILTISSK